MCIRDSADAELIGGAQRLQIELAAGVDDALCLESEHLQFCMCLLYTSYALTDELRQIQKDERMSTQQKAQRAREIAKKESEKLFMGTEVVHNPVKELSLIHI